MVQQQHIIRTQRISTKLVKTTTARSKNKWTKIACVGVQNCRCSREGGGSWMWGC